MLGIAFTCGLIGGSIGKRKGREWAEILLGIFLSVIGIVIIASMPPTDEARIADAQKQFEIQAEAARRAGLPVASATPGRTTGVAEAVGDAGSGSAWLIPDRGDVAVGK